MEAEIARRVVGNANPGFPREFLHRLGEADLMDTCYQNMDTPTLALALQGVHSNDYDALRDACKRAIHEEDSLYLRGARAHATLGEDYQRACHINEVVHLMVDIVFPRDGEYLQWFGYT